MKVLIGFERSGIIRDAFIKRGHDAISCDLEPTKRPGPHLQCSIWEVLEEPEIYDLGIFHPVCTYLCSSGLHWNGRTPGRAAKTEAALEDVLKLMKCKIKRKAIENPRGCIGTRIRKANQWIQPYQFGHDASKNTGLWLNNLPPLTIKPELYIPPRIVDGKPRWANQTDSGQNKLTPSADRAEKRAETYQGWADAMAEDWGCLTDEDIFETFVQQEFLL